jgi:hypothetical protein
MGTNSAILQSPWELRLFPPARSLVDALFPRRLHRLAYLLRALPVALGCGFLEDNYTAIPLWWAWLTLALAYDLFFIEVPRIHDVEMSPWWLLLAFVPGPNFALALILVFRAPCFPRPPAPPEPTPPIENRAIA